MDSNIKNIGLLELWNILYDEEFRSVFLGDDIVLAEEHDSRIDITTVSTSPHKVTYLLCNYLLYSVFNCQVNELKKGALEDQFNAFSKMILSACFAINKKQSGIVKNTHIKYHDMLQILSKNIDKIIVEQGSLYSSVLHYTYAFWEKAKDSHKITELHKEKPTYQELRRYENQCRGKIYSKIEEVKDKCNFPYELPTDWPDPYEILASYTLLILLGYSYPDFLETQKEKVRYSEVIEYKNMVLKGIKDFFARGYVDKVQLTNEDVLEIWIDELQSIIDWCDDFSNNNPELQVGGLKVNFQKFQSDKVERYIRAYNISSKKEIRQIIEQMKADLESIPALMEKLAHMREMAERLKKNPMISQQFVNNMDEIAKTFTIGTLKNETRRDD